MLYSIIVLLLIIVVRLVMDNRILAKRVSTLSKTVKDRNHDIEWLKYAQHLYEDNSL